MKKIILGAMLALPLAACGNTVSEVEETCMYDFEDRTKICSGPAVEEELRDAMFESIPAERQLYERKSDGSFVPVEQ